MKSTVLITAGTSLLLTAAALVLHTAPESTPVAEETRKQSRTVTRVLSTPVEDSAEAANPRAEREHSEESSETSPELEDALDALLAQVVTTYSSQVQVGIARLAELPPTGHDGELVEIGRAVSEEMDDVLEDMGIVQSRRALATAAAADTVIAEIKYAGAAPDPASRLALLWLDREREARAGESMAITDATLKSQALSEIEAWYEEGLDGILATTATD